MCTLYRIVPAISELSSTTKEGIQCLLQLHPIFVHFHQLEKSEGTPSILYKQKIGTCGPLQDHTSLMLPRNQKQIKNLQSM